jgi:hypothetical protein
MARIRINDNPNQKEIIVDSVFQKLVSVILVFVGIILLVVSLVINIFGKFAMWTIILIPGILIALIAVLSIYFSKFTIKVDKTNGNIGLFRRSFFFNRLLEEHSLNEKPRITYFERFPTGFNTFFSARIETSSMFTLILPSFFNSKGFYLSKEQLEILSKEANLPLVYGGNSLNILKSSS